MTITNQYGSVMCRNAHEIGSTERQVSSGFFFSRLPQFATNGDNV